VASNNETFPRLEAATGARRRVARKAPTRRWWQPTRAEVRSTAHLELQVVADRYNVSRGSVVHARRKFGIESGVQRRRQTPLPNARRPGRSIYDAIESDWTGTGTQRADAPTLSIDIPHGVGILR
jgi:hypothetical protein